LRLAPRICGAGCGNVPIGAKSLRKLSPRITDWKICAQNNSMRRNTMKALIMAVALMGMTGFAYCAETMGEKAEAVTNDAARAAKKGLHRAEEAVCAEGDLKCLSEKAKHRAEEGKDYTKDKAKELKNQVDSDKS
jgi:hypothetical protein